MKTSLPLVVVCAFLSQVGSVSATDWLQFRGRGGLGVSTEKNLPTTWSKTSNVLWKTELPGAGSSSPIVVGKKILVTTYSGHGDGRGQGAVAKLTRHLVCLDSGGKILWHKDMPADQPEDAYRGYLANHGYASSTPVSDGTSVYVFFNKSGVYAFDLDGKQLWKSSVGTDRHSWGAGTSPILYKDLLVINASVESGALVALDKKDGKPVWSTKGMSMTWATPFLATLPGGRQELIVSNRGHVIGFDPDKGTELWRCASLQGYVCPSVVVHGDVVYVIGDRFRNTAMAIRAGGTGDVSRTNVLWKLNKGSNVCSPVYHEGYLYWGKDDRGIVYCVKADTGKLVYEQKLDPAADGFYASPVVADGRIYYVSRTKGAYVLEASPKFHLLAHNTLGDTTYFQGSPVITDGHILLRSDRYLYCLGGAK